MGTARRKKTEIDDLRMWRRLYAGMAMMSLIVSGKLAEGKVNKLAWARMAYEWADAMLHAGKVH